MIETFTKETFDPLVNTPFRLRVEGPEGSAPEMVLTETSGKSQRGMLSFSLIFRGPRNLPRQGTFPLEHDALGAFDLFMTAVGEDEDGLYLQAVFTRLVASPS